MKRKKALVTASVASMIDLFNMDNISILQELGYEVHVAANFQFGNITSRERVAQFQKELKEAGIRAYHVPIPRSVRQVKQIMDSYRQMKQLCRREQYQIIHTQSPIGGVVARSAAKGLPKKGTTVLYTAHGFHFFRGAPKKNKLFFYPIEKYFSRYTDILITINREDYQKAKEFSAKKVCYVPGIGVDLARFRAPFKPPKQLREEFGIAKNDFVVLSVGQLSARKNQETVIRAMAQIKDKSIKYVVVGLGEKEREDHGLIRKLHLEQQVTLAGYRRDINDLLHMADCFVFPSLQEGLPVSLMEAMAAGTPVICSRIRGNTDLITDQVEGILVNATDTAGYAKAIVEMKRCPKRANAYVEAAHEKIKGFSIENIHKKMEEIYRSISG